MNPDSKIYVAGHRGMVGSAIVRILKGQGFNNLVLLPRNVLDLTNQKDVDVFFREETPNIVFMAAAKVGGIYSNNSYPAEFIYENMMVQCNVINAAFNNNVKIIQTHNFINALL